MVVFALVSFVIIYLFQIDVDKNYCILIAILAALFSLQTKLIEKFDELIDKKDQIITLLDKEKQQ